MMKVVKYPWLALVATGIALMIAGAYHPAHAAVASSQSASGIASFGQSLETPADKVRQQWVTAHYRYWQEGLRSGLAANKLAAEAQPPFAAASDAQKQQWVTAHYRYWQEGLRSGLAANKLAAQASAQPQFVAASDAQRQQWVTDHYRYWQEGLRSGLAANRLSGETAGS